MTRFSVLGASGFVGSALARELISQGHDVYAPSREEEFDLSRNLGHVIYCIGLTADFRSRIFDTVEAHVSLLARLLKKSQFESFLYLSSTRVYEYSQRTEEEGSLVVNPLNPNHIFNLTKLTGEALCFGQNRPEIRVVRVSNVLGEDFNSSNFLFSLFKDAKEHGEMVLRTTRNSSKDYIWVEDVVRMLPQLALGGKHQLYNLGSGVNYSNIEVVEEISKASGAKYHFSPNAAEIIFPHISIQRMVDEFQFRPKPILSGLGDLYRKYSSLRSN